MIGLAACHRQPEPAAQAPEIAFDGAEVTDAAARIAHGERLTYVLGCRGCHGKQLQGELWDDDPKEYGILWASNVTRIIPTVTDEQLETLLRRGLHPTRKDLWVMPSEMFQHMSAPDMTALIAYLRTLKPSGEESPPPAPGPKAIAEIASGKVKPAATLVRELKATLPVDTGASHALGRYMTSLTCAECHGPKLEGIPRDTPDLVVASAYSREEFERLMTQGVASGGRKIQPLMSQVARSRFSHMTRHERDELYAYLKARAEPPQ